EQAAGFLRVPESENPLDNTGVHPERYPVLESLAQRLSKSLRDLTGGGAEAIRQDSAFKEEVGAFTYDDILSELEKPGRDPRETFVPFSYRDDIHEVKDLKPGMICPGIVTNVTNFGAFVDIGVHQDGLVHLSQLARQFVKDASQVVSPGDRVQVKVLEVNLEKNQISLSIKEALEGPAPRPRRAEGEGRPPRGGKRGGGRRDQGPPRGSRPSAPRPVFNNAFASLAALRDQLKPKK
ncbi:MAG: S1 RNA-binding domain-containing protein, partial [Deltaproteobacteria bacterium]|nr:S1 RNA-binding domain-containing protein [Deltaproteobacteria bacterium]